MYMYTFSNCPQIENEIDIYISRALKMSLTKTKNVVKFYIVKNKVYDMLVLYE